MPSSEPVVLDTHVWLDVAFGRGRFSPRIRKLIDRAALACTLYVAAITPWEVAMLARAGKLRVAGPTVPWLTKALQATGTAVAPLELEVAVDAAELPPWEHGDPADRMIVATARAMNAVLVTRDARILEFAGDTRAVRALEPS